MSCANQVLTGLAKDCSTSMGGIKTVYIANYDDVTDVLMVELDPETKEPIKGKDDKEISTDHITKIVMADGKKFQQYSFRKGTGSMNSNLTIDAANGVNYVTTDLNLSFLKMETVKRVEMAALAVNEVVCIVEDSNGVFWYLGKDEPVTCTAGTGETGQARGDGNKYGITLQDTSVTYPYEVDPSIIAGLK